MSEEYDYKKKLRLFELDMLKKGHKFMNIPDAIAPELRDECYSSGKDSFFKQNDLADGLSAGRFYYVRKKKGKIVIRQTYLYSCLTTEKAIPFVDFDDNDIEKVLAPVPSYDELQSLKAQLAEHKEYCCCAKNEVLVLENANLKELLEECQTRITECLYKIYDEGGQSYPNLEEDLKSLLTNIKEALK